jgi:hypothetical protein
LRSAGKEESLEVANDEDSSLCRTVSTAAEAIKLASEIELEVVKSELAQVCRQPFSGLNFPFQLCKRSIEFSSITCWTAVHKHNAL